FRHKITGMAAGVYYLWVVLLLLACGVAWLLTFVTLPGNWIIVIFAALFAWLIPVAAGRGISWTIVAVLLGLAVLGEVVEFAASAASAAKQGASKRGIALAMIGAIVGSAIGLAIGAPIPILGSFVMALLGGAVGAFIGAYIGEGWKGRAHEERLAAGRGAFAGRVWGTVGKLAVGAVMLVIVAWDAFF
ncbi:MAG TPA: DUF456 domain-containing protein, partial [Lacipirellulaceae bacterium]|nr:DUF456 domain-containing protein [Lacipirellulaceae bacterium]